MKWPLKKKLYFAFGAMLSLMGLLSLVSLLRMESSAELESEQLRYVDLAHTAQAMQTAMVRARLHEKDFFGNYGDERFESLQAERKQEFASLAESLASKLTNEDTKLSDELKSARDSFAAYSHALDVAVAQYKVRGTHESGLQLEFRRAAHAIEEAAKDVDDLGLHVLLLQIRRHEKDYLLRGEALYKEKLNVAVDELQKYVRQHGEFEKVLQLANDYRQKFNAAYEASEKLEARQKDLHDTTILVEDSLKRLQENANLAAATIRAEGLAARRNSQVVMLSVFAAAIMLAFGVARVLSTQLSGAVSALMDGTLRISRGELSHTVIVDSQDELGELARSFNGMSDSLRKMSRDINEATISIDESVRELQATVSEQGAALQQQASSVSETVATVDEMSRSSSQVSETANQVLDSASRAMTTSDEGRKAISLSVKGMHDVREQVQNIATTILELSDKTAQIGGIIATVDDFAEQSSLLALNASIEAARAGENGKAFSVVAGEVKNLAEQSQRATEKVRAILNDIQRATHTAVMVTEEGSKRVDRGVELVNSAGEVIRQLAGAIGASSDSAKQIASAARQQSNGVEQITVAISGIDQFSRQNLEAIKQTEETAQNLVAIAKQLKSSAERYQA